MEGQNLRIDVRRAGHSPAEDAEAIRPLVESPPDAILVDTSTLATRTHEATRTIPIVFTGVADPIGTGLIKNFARPGGNATGVHYSQLEIGAKRLELLRDLLPQARRVMVVRYFVGGELDMLPHLRNTASRLGLEIVEIATSWMRFDPPSVLRLREAGRDLQRGTMDLQWRGARRRPDHPVCRRAAYPFAVRGSGGCRAGCDPFLRGQFDPRARPGSRPTRACAEGHQGRRATSGHLHRV